MRGAVGHLPDRDQRVLALRFGLELSQTEIAARIGVSLLQVSRMLRAILTGLRAKTRLTVGGSDADLPGRPAAWPRQAVAPITFSG